jgi:hypothetical protein
VHAAEVTAFEVGALELETQFAEGLDLGVGRGPVMVRTH